MGINVRTLAFLIGMSIFGAFTWALLSPLFTERKVDEALPANVVLPTREQMQAMPAPRREQTMLDIMAQFATLPQRAVADTMPSTVVLAAPREGQFGDFDAVHKGTGKARIYRLDNGSSLLRLEEFRVTNGPDLVVYLVAHPNPKNASDVRLGRVSLGPLKGNAGNQNYAIAETVNPDLYRSVVIWCELFDVIFAVAPLSSPPAARP